MIKLPNSLYVSLVVTAVALASCKQAEFSAGSRKKLGGDVTRNGGPSAPGGDDATGKPGTGKPGSKPGDDGKKPNDTGGNPTIDATGGPGKPTDKPIDSDNGLTTGPTSEVSIVGLRLDSNDSAVKLHFKKRDGTWGEVAWPKKGQTVKIEGVCDSKKDVKVEIKTTLRETTYVPTSTSCFVGKQESPSKLHVGFEHDCSSTNFNKIDDSIATFSCPDKGITIEHGTMDRLSSFV